MADPGLLTVGHGRLDQDAFAALLRDASVELLVDVRRFPGSRANPAVSRDALASWLPGIGVDYLWEERLGGRRSLPKDAESQDSWWQVAAFRAYAAHTRSEDFREAMPALVEQAQARRVAVMCSESVWWRCHRRIVADVAVLGYDVPVEHLMHDGRLVAHRPAAGARLRPDGLVVWDRT